MLPRHYWLLGWLLCLGCTGLPDIEPAQEAKESAPASRLWEQGQAAMQQGQSERAIGYYEQSLRVDPTLTRNHMSLAAAWLERGDDAAAAVHLGRYVEAHPEHLEIRAQYAELLLRLKRPDSARIELAHLAADVQELGKEGLSQLISCHSRLVELAEDQDDDYEMHLHRGIGLYYLARQRAKMDDPEGKMPVEGLLCKAAGELTQARLLRPTEARPHWYLYSVWSQLAQQSPARRCLHEAAAAAPFSELTPAEQRRLVLACRAQEADHRH